MLRLGMIGCGEISQTHRARFHALASRMTVVATADIVPERAQEAAQIVGASAAVTDFRDLLPLVGRRPDRAPHHLHHPVGMECLAAGKHVLMEKPLANSERECLELIEASERQGVKLMVAYCMRFHPLTQ